MSYYEGLHGRAPSTITLVLIIISSAFAQQLGDFMGPLHLDTVHRLLQHSEYISSIRAFRRDNMIYAMECIFCITNFTCDSSKSDVLSAAMSSIDATCFTKSTTARHDDEAHTRPYRALIVFCPIQDIVNRVSVIHPYT